MHALNNFVHPQKTSIDKESFKTNYVSGPCTFEGEVVHIDTDTKE